jgi:hypothetical protein
MMLKVGPFSDWDICFAFLKQWMGRKRGKQRRLERGIELYALYREAYDLVLWSQTQTQPPLLPPAVAALDDDEDNEDNEDNDNKVELPSSEKRHRVESAEEPLSAVKHMFAANTSLTMHALVGVCERFQIK